MMVTHGAAGREGKMVKGVLIDLDGVVYVGNQALPGSLDAIRRIRELRIPCKFITTRPAVPGARL